MDLPKVDAPAPTARSLDRSLVRHADVQFILAVVPDNLTCARVTWEMDGKINVAAILADAAEREPRAVALPLEGLGGPADRLEVSFLPR
jgi:hypothetical protein